MAAPIIGLDIGGSKIAGAAYDAAGAELERVMLPTPANYEALLDCCRTIVGQLEQKTGAADSIGVCAPYSDALLNANIPFMIGKNLPQDLEKMFGRPVPLGNDANLAAYAEAMEGAGRGYRAVFGLIMGTGVGGGFVFDGHVVVGPNNMTGEIGHLPLPYYEASDGERVACGCGQTGCIDKLVGGPALARLYRGMTGNDADGRKITEQVQRGDADALRVLDRYYTVVAKAMIVILHSFDPDIITVSGGLSILPGLYDEVPKRWGRYAVNKKLVTKFVPAQFGSLAGMRGAALFGKNN